MNLGILVGVIATLIVYTEGKDDYTLPSTVTPSHYSLTLHIDPDYDSFNGSVRITFVTNEETKTISLHASPNYIDIKRIARISDTLRTNAKDNCNVDSDNNITEIVTITCEDEFAANEEQQLTFYFDGKYSEESHGIFKVEYKENDTTERMVVTQFEPTYARRVFPCFDEPEFKATYEVIIYHPKEYNVIFNTAVASNKENVTKFRTTPLMSSYLLAFAVSKFEPTTSSDDTLPFTVYSRPSAKSRTGTAVKYGPLLLKYFKEYLKINYVDLGNKKMDMIAVPDKFGGAMENWGLIIFSELDLLDDGNETTANQKQIIVSTMAHEIAHQWFGNYVTLDWWSNTWLNEGFATFFQYLIPDNIEGDDDLRMDLSKQFIIEVMSNALQTDSYISNPLSSEKDDVQTQDKISKKFDEISYNKGASVIRMMQNVLGGSFFKQALGVYLSTNKLSNIGPSQLFAAMQSVYQNNHRLSEELESYIYQSGYPLVTAMLANNTLIRITQEPFKILEEHELKNTTWNFPLNYKSFKEGSTTLTDQWIEEDGFEITINEDDCVILNLERTGYYRVNYDQILWERIIDQLKGDNSFSEIDVLNRVQLIDDVFNVARTGKVSYEIVFNLAEYLKNETEYYPWAAFFNAVSYLMEHISDHDTLYLLKKTTLSWIKNAFPDFIQNSTNHVDILRDNLINQWKCALGDDDCLDYVKTEFDSVQKGGSFKNINDRYLVYCNAFTTSSKSKEVYEFLMQKLKDSDSAYERNDILKALACSQFQTQYLAELLLSNDTVISLVEAKTVFNAIIDKGGNGPMKIVMFLMDSAEDVVKKYKNFISFPTLAYKIAMKSNTDAHLKMALNNISSYIVIENVNEIITTIDNYVKVNSDWNKSYRNKIKKQLKKMDGSAENMLHPQILVTLLPISLAILFVGLL